MKYTLHELSRSKLEDFANKYNLEMVVRERKTDKVDHKYYARFNGVEIVDGAILITTHGNGHTPEAAIYNYKNAISEKKIKISKGMSESIYVNVPILI